MTESERIISEGILPPSFFYEEERCGFPISANMKKIWAIELDLYLKFAAICERYRLRYYLIFGSLLGAIRHKGMIPWDDDMDVCMPREDYNFLCKNCISEFNDPYILQTPFSDVGSFFSFAKIRNKNTTCVSSVMNKAPFCQGVFLDVFPLDFCDPRTYEQDREEIYRSIMKCSYAMKKYNRDVEDLKSYLNEEFYSDNPLSEYEKVQRIASNLQYRNSNYIGIPVNTILKPKQLIWKVSDFSSYQIVPFETINVRIPNGYDDILCSTYGDYMQYPPVEKRGVTHSGLIWDPDKPYDFSIVV